MTSKLQINIKL